MQAAVLRESPWTQDRCTAELLQGAAYTAPAPNQPATTTSTKCHKCRSQQLRGIKTQHQISSHQSHLETGLAANWASAEILGGSGVLAPLATGQSQCKCHRAMLGPTPAFSATPWLPQTDELMTRSSPCARCLCGEWRAMCPRGALLPAVEQSALGLSQCRGSQRPKHASLKWLTKCSCRGDANEYTGCQSGCRSCGLKKIVHPIAHQTMLPDLSTSWPLHAMRCFRGIKREAVNDRGKRSSQMIQ